jgi:hypothetical protein
MSTLLSFGSVSLLFRCLTKPLLPWYAIAGVETGSQVPGT